MSLCKDISCSHADQAAQPKKLSAAHVENNAKIEIQWDWEKNDIKIT